MLLVERKVKFMMKKISALLVMATVSLGAQAALTAGTDAKVEMVVPTTVTQVVAFDGKDTFVMSTTQKVETVVTVTKEMANKAKIFSQTGDVLPAITSLAEVADTGEYVASEKPFAKTGSIEPIATSRTVINTVYVKDGEDFYSFETVENVGDNVKLTEEIVGKLVKVKDLKNLD